MSQQTFPPKPLDPMRVTTRNIPMRCGACEGTGWDPRFDADDMESCPACEQKGWLWITETSTEPAMPTTGNFTVPLTGYACPSCHQWVSFGVQHFCTAGGNR